MGNEYMQGTECALLQSVHAVGGAVGAPHQEGRVLVRELPLKVPDEVLVLGLLGHLQARGQVGSCFLCGTYRLQTH